MTAVATRSRAAAAIARKGQTVTIAGSTAGVYDSATDTVSGTPYSETASAVILPLNPFKLRDDSNVRQGDETMLLSALSASGAPLAEPPLDAVVTLANGDKYTLISVDPLHPDGTELLFDCVIRGASA